MAVSTGTIFSVNTEQSQAGIPGDLQVARVLFNIPTTETYAQANDAIINAVPTAIQNSRRNGKTVTLRDATFCQPAALTASPYTIHTCKTVTVSGATITFELCVADYTTEYANATPCPALSNPLGFLVTFTEA